MKAIKEDPDMTYDLLQELFLEKDLEEEYANFCVIKPPKDCMCLLDFVSNLQAAIKYAEKLNLDICDEALKLEKASRHISKRNKWVKDNEKLAAVSAVSRNNGTQFGHPVMFGYIESNPIFCCIAGASLTDDKRKKLVPAIILLLNMHFLVLRSDKKSQYLPFFNAACRSVRKMSHPDFIRHAEAVNFDIGNAEIIVKELRYEIELNKQSEQSKDNKSNINDILFSLARAVEVIVLELPILKRNREEYSGKKPAERITWGISGFLNEKQIVKKYGVNTISQTNGDDEEQFEFLEYDLGQTARNIEKLTSLHRKQAIRSSVKAGWYFLNKTTQIGWKKIFCKSSYTRWDITRSREFVLQYYLSIVLCIDISDVFEIVVSDRSVSEEKNSNRIIFHRKENRISKPISKNLKPSEKIYNYSKNYCRNSRWNIPIIDSVAAFINAICDKKSNTFHIFDKTIDDYKSVDFSDHMGRGDLVKLKKYAIFYYYNILNIGHITSCYLTNTSSAKVAAASSYWSIPQAYIDDASRSLQHYLFDNSIKEIGIPKKGDSLSRFGSERVALRSAVSNALRIMKDGISKTGRPTKSESKRIKYHNNFVSYVVFLVLLTTGVRINKPLNSCILRLCRITGCLELSDKEVTSSYARITPLSPQLISLLDKYKEHTEGIRKAFKLEKYKAEFDFFFIDESLSKIDITKSSYDHYIFPKTGLVDNFSRHYSVRIMLENGVPETHIMMFLGHRRFGLEYDQRHSSVSPLDYRHSISLAFEKEFKKLLLVSQGRML
ncbi:MAG: hypothetical protein ACI9VT_001373 [Psychroserpens sp.]|jgi:hypothetical protein